MSQQIVVLGMHRSGTSMVAGILFHLGVFMGYRLLGPSPSNELGHFEDVDFVTVNRAILDEAGGTWDTVPSQDAITSVAGYADRIRFMVEARDVMFPLWGWKDPRTVVTIGHYEQHLTNPLYIAVFRGRDAVVKSLVTRDGRSAENAGMLYDTYADRLATFLDGRMRVQVNYEEVLDAPEQCVEMLAALVNVPVTDKAIAFVRPELNHA